MTRLFSVLFLFAPIAGFAHMTGQPHHTIASGLFHPLTGIDHLLALLAVGWIAHRPQAAWQGTVLFCLFLGSMFAGAVNGIGGSPSLIAEYVICISLILSGVTIAAPTQGKYAALLLIVAGLAHGFAHGSECPAGSGSVPFLAGMVAGSALLLTLGRLAHRRIEAGGAQVTVRLAISCCLTMAGALLLSRV